MNTRAKLVLPLLLVGAALAAVPAGAGAADVVSPVDGATVSSQPQFLFDFENGSADVEMSTSPDVKTAGAEAGKFVERAGYSTHVYIGPWDVDHTDNPAGASAPLSGHLNAGRYFWHAQPTVRSSFVDRWGDLGYHEETMPWTPVRTLTVRDEPATFEGWTLRVQRGHTRKGCARVAVNGTIAWSDNAAKPAARYTVRFVAGGRTVGKVTGRFSSSYDFDSGFAGTICTHATRLAVTATLRDTAGQLTAGPVKQLRVRRPGV